jgi:hypothetical protein
MRAQMHFDTTRLNLCGCAATQRQKKKPFDTTPLVLHAAKPHINVSLRLCRKYKGSRKEMI